ncbi:MAG: hypothetical protein R3D80_11385 [Paracoccaceae bacterium]
MNSPIPSSRVGRRPKLSENGPRKIWPIPVPMTKDEIASWARDGASGMKSPAISGQGGHDRVDTERHQRHQRGEQHHQFGLAQGAGGGREAHIAGSVRTRHAGFSPGIPAPKASMSVGTRTGPVHWLRRGGAASRLRVALC